VVAYYWSILAADTSKPPARLGITGDRKHAQKIAEPLLLSDGTALLALVEAVRPVLAPSLGQRYQRTGQTWTGRRTLGDGVHWTEHARDDDR
jgi:hypothetical protein